MNLRIRFAAVLVLVASTFGATLVASASEHEHQYYPFATDEFHAVWERTDRPVLEMVEARTWIWGPGANHPDLIEEDYVEAEDGTRLVQYTDKSRMEWPWSPDADPESPWFITQGLLATELMTGNLQIGEASFEQHLPANRPAAGDPDDVTGPTYAAMGLHIDRPPREQGGVIIEVIDRDGFIIEDLAYAEFGVTDEFQVADVEGIDKNIASVFWAHMNSQATVYVDGNYVQDDLYVNPFYAIGYPKTDAFWAEVKVDDEVQPVLIQCFERRCLTYTPGNPEGWEVESGNIGQHYYDWRYNLIDRDAPVVPTDGTFTFEGASEAPIDVGESVVLTAQVRVGEVPLRGFDVHFAILDGDDVISLNTDMAITNSYGNAFVTVTGDAEGTAEVMAFVDLDGSGTFNAETDLDLGTVNVTVEAVDNGNGDNGNGEPALPTFTTFDVSDLDGLSSGQSGDVVVGIQNPDVAAGGQSYTNVAFNLTIEVPDGGTCEGDDWTDWFEFTGIAAPANANMTCVNGAFEGQIGTQIQIPLAAGASLNQTFDLQVNSGALAGQYHATLELYDQTTNEVLADASGSFSISE